ncbi:MAG: hypothetical protein K6G10_03770 [Butyrivibrio sp.]|nr:hypothetical protein [Butyrivibrio sp.]
MKKKVVFFVIIIMIIALGVFCAVRFKISNDNKDPREARRQEVSSDEDLELVTGDDEPRAVNADGSKNSNQVTESVISSESNKPASEDVESVRTMSIPEALVINEGDSASFYSNEDFLNVTPVDVKSFDETDLPPKYRSDETENGSYVTAVEDQGYTYLCWTYAALGAIESDLLKHNKVTGTDSIDLSEKHLAYYNVHRSKGSVNGYIDGDYRELVDNGDSDKNWIFDYDTNYVSVGGVTDYCISLLTAWKGPVSEKDNDAFKSIYGQEFVFKDNTDKPSDAYDAEYHVQAVNEVCADTGNRAMVKEMIMEHGAVTIGVSAAEKYWVGRNSNLYSSFGGEKPPTADHEVLVIGWDDDYPATNFATAPKGDGAWICKNSWGTTLGKKGFFYLSYYDETALNSNAAAFSSAAKGDRDFYDNNYQVAGFLTDVNSTLDDTQNTVYSYTASSNPYACLYRAAGEEKLEAVGFMSLETYQQYTAEVYLDPAALDGQILFENLGEPVLSQKISAISGGFHTFELDKKIDLSKGQSFLVMIKPYTKGRLVFEKAQNYISGPNYDEWNNLTGSFLNNYEASLLSYYITDDGLGLKSQDDKDFFIKAYTKNK